MKLDLRNFVGNERKVKAAFEKLTREEVEDIANYMGVETVTYSLRTPITDDLLVERIMSAMKR